MISCMHSINRSQNWSLSTKLRKYKWICNEPLPLTLLSIILRIHSKIQLAINYKKDLGHRVLTCSVQTQANSQKMETACFKVPMVNSVSILGAVQAPMSLMICLSSCLTLFSFSILSRYRNNYKNEKYYLLTKLFKG
jgi:hypothetical protein